MFSSLMKVRNATVVVFAFLILLAVAGTVPAQFPMSDGRSSASTERELEEHVAQMRYLIAQANKRRPTKHVDPQLAFQQLQEDFTKIQITNRDLVLTTDKTQSFDLKFVSRSAEEINKRAKRLLENLALPEPEQEVAKIKPGPIQDRAQLKRSITQMGWLIYYFAKSPIFKEASVIETAAATKVRTELEQVVELSALIKSSSEQLGKTER